MVKDDFVSFSNANSGDDKLYTLLPWFSDDSLAPLEFLEVCRRKTYQEPEKRLMLALLTDAVYCFQHYLGVRKRTPRKLFKAADEWIFQNESDALFSFASVCEHLGIDPGYLRAGLHRCKGAHFAESSAQGMLESLALTEQHAHRLRRVMQ